MRASLRFWLAAVLAGCGGGSEKGCDDLSVTRDPIDCGTLSSATWQIGPYAWSWGEDKLRVEVGGSRAVFLDHPYVESQCLDTAVVSVAWTVDDVSAATVTPKDPPRDGCWVSGRAPRTTAVRARIAFSDGIVQEPAPRAIQVVVHEPPAGSVVVAEGRVDLGGGSTDSSWYVPFTVPVRSRQLDIATDWDSPLRRVGFALFQGECAGPNGSPCSVPLRFIFAPTAYDVKPLRDTLSSPAPDTYTIRIDNDQSGPQTARYEVRVTPE